MTTLVTASTSPLRSEADVIKTLDRGVYTLDEMYRLVEARADISRAGGLEPIADATDTRWRRRARGALQQLRATGAARRLDRSVWMIDRPMPLTRRMLLVSLHGSVAEIELRVSAAIDLLNSLDEPADLVLCDPPFGLGRRGGDDLTNGQGRVYRRDQDRVVAGYQDVEERVYAQFAAGWVTAAARALRPGGQLAVITGPQRAAVHQVAAEHAGLHWVQTIVAKREFALYMRRRCSPSHWAITVMCNGPINGHRRVFHCPPDLPVSHAGNAYPTDMWLDNGRSDRHGVLRYDNSLPMKLVRRLILMLSNPGDLVVDPCTGGGTVPIGCWETGRRCVAGDINAHAISFAAARLLAEHAWPRDRAPELFDAAMT